MDLRLVLGVALIALPIAFNGLFFALARAFAYPAILRRDPGEVLVRFTAGGRRLQVLWWGFMLTAVALVPVAALLSVELAAAGPWLVQLGLALGVVAGLVQALGLARWPFLVPVLTRLQSDARTDADRAAVTVAFEVTHRYLGVAVGEHLGYLLTGAWTAAVGLALVASPQGSDLLGWLGVGVGAALAVGSLEFVGRPGARGWSVAERLVPLAYTAWSLWLISLGVAILLELR